MLFGSQGSLMLVNISQIWLIELITLIWIHLQKQIKKLNFGVSSLDTISSTHKPFLTGMLLVLEIKSLQVVSFSILVLKKQWMILTLIVIFFLNLDIYSYCYYNDSFALSGNE